ncbi:MAG: enoyl-CoA hydratase/isomerase family protein [Gemmatimonadota bacterium]|nr:MAG: enoyl-CoA hydratase/isomerase family protein [Gemmatimonadota bacterium]
MDYKNILIDREEHVAVLTINRPDKMNALNDDVIAEMRAAFDELESDQEIRVIVVTGAGDKAFVAGADIKELSTLNALQGVAKSERGQVLMFNIANMNKPVIMAINGFALGGGCELAMAGDIRLASDKAKLGQPEITLGIIPGYGGTQRLPRLVGKGKALEILLTGKMIKAEEALQIGLVDKVVPHDSLMDEAKGLAKAMANLAPIALALIKKCVYYGLETDLKSGCTFESLQFGAVCTTDDMAEGTKAFLEKRKPEFRGK